MSLSVSLCICTMNRPDDLATCLASIAALPARPHEVLVSDDSKDPSLIEANRRVVAAHPGVTWVKGPSRGLSVNRNHCLDRVTGDLVVFVDDDVTLHPDFLQKGAERFERLAREAGNDRFVLTGHEIQPTGPGYPSRLNFLGFYCGRPPEGVPPSAICINATLFPRSLFDRARFDEHIRFGAEERDISFQATWLGYRIVYDPGLNNFHNPSPVNRDLYEASTVIGRVYFGLKRYWVYERSLPRFVAFNALVLANAVGNRLKALRFRDSAMVIGAFGTAWRLFLQRPPRAPGRT